MRRRPQPNRRRGLLRAAAAVVVLAALVVAALLIISSLTAPAAKAPTIAPTVPPTPGRTVPTPSPPVRTVPPATLHPTAQPTVKKRRAALGVDTNGLADRPPRTSVLTATRADRIYWFHGQGNVYAGKALSIRTSAGSPSLLVGRADPYVRPVWSGDGRFVLYVRVRAVAHFPGARWALMRYDTRTHANVELAHAFALDLFPLGWSQGRILFVAARSTDSGIFAVTARGVRYVGILATQPLTSGQLSPSGQFIAFTAPASCRFCTLDLFDLEDSSTWNGPSGLASESSIAWTEDSRFVIGQETRGLFSISAGNHDWESYAPAGGLPLVWGHPMRARVSGQSLLLIDRTTGKAYHSAQRDTG